MSRWHQDIKPRNILVKSKKGGSPYDYEFKLADLGLSHFKKHVPSQRGTTDRDTYGTRTYGRLHSHDLPYSIVADHRSGAPECYRADSNIERIQFLVKQDIDIWSLGCVFSEAAVWVVRGKDTLSEYGRQREIETAQIHDFRDGDCFHDGWQVLGTVKDIHRDLTDDIRPRDHVTGAMAELVTKEMLIESEFRTPAKTLNYRIKGILDDAETKLRRSPSYAGTGSASGTVAQSPPRTPPEPPPGHSQPRSSNLNSHRVPSPVFAGSPASTSYDEDDSHHKAAILDCFGNRTSQQAHYSDRATRR